MTSVIRLSAACLLTLFITATFTSCNNKKEPIKIGFVAGITGRVADLGVAGRNGAMLAVEDRNAAGGVNGHPIELVIRDDEQNPETARRVVTELINGNIEVIIGPMTSSMAMATVPLVNASKTIMISPTVTTTELVDLDDNFLRVIATTTDYAAKSAHCQFDRCCHRSIAAIYDIGNKSYTESWLNDFSKTFTGKGGRMVKTVPFQSGMNVDLTKLAKELLAVKPDSILILTNAIDAAILCQKIRNIDDKMPIVMAEWASTERFIELAGAAAEGVHVSQFLDRNDTSVRYQSFLKAYRTRFGQDPGFAGVTGYDAVSITLDALGRRPSGKSLKETILATGALQGLQQTITIDRYGDANRKTFLARINKGQYVSME